MNTQDIVNELKAKVISYGKDIVWNGARQEFRIVGQNDVLTKYERRMSADDMRRAYNKGFIALNEASLMWQRYNADRFRPQQFNEPITEEMGIEQFEFAPFWLAARINSIEDITVSSQGVTDYDQIEEVHGCRLEPEDFTPSDFAQMAQEARKALDAARIQTSYEAGRAADIARDIKDCLRDGNVKIYEVQEYLDDLYDEQHALRIEQVKCRNKTRHAEIRTKLQFVDTMAQHLENELMSNRYGVTAEGICELEYSEE